MISKLLQRLSCFFGYHPAPYLTYTHTRSTITMTCQKCGHSWSKSRLSLRRPPPGGGPRGGQRKRDAA